MKTKTLTLTYTYSKILFWISVMSIVLLALAYMFFVNETVRSVVLRQQLEKQVSSLDSTIATLEFEYVSQSHSIDLVLATALGFNEARNPTFVSKKQAVSFGTTGR